jgi:hypothetical protein
MRQIDLREIPRRRGGVLSPLLTDVAEKLLFSLCD